MKFLPVLRSGILGRGFGDDAGELGEGSVWIGATFAGKCRWDAANAQGDETGAYRELHDLLRAHRRWACLPNLVRLSAEIGFTRRRDNPAIGKMIYASTEIIITRAHRGWLVAGGTIDRLRRSAPT